MGHCCTEADNSKDGRYKNIIVQGGKVGDICFGLREKSFSMEFEQITLH